jgi:hypothetical protein
MPVTRKLLAQHNNEENQWLKVDHNSRYIVNVSPEWQFLFGPNSALSTGSRVIKLAAQLDTSTLDKIRLIGYLYNSDNASVDSAASATFSIYRVEDITTPKWNEVFIANLGGIEQTNSYYFADIDITSITGASLDGDTTLMIEGTVIRSGVTYRDRIYVNHLGIYDSVVRLRNAVDFLDITKLDE